MVELNLTSIIREAEGRNIPNKYYILRPRSARSKVKGHLQLYHAYIRDPAAPPDANESDTTIEELENSNSAPENGGAGGVSGDDWEIVGSSEPPADTAVRGMEELPAPITMGPGAGTRVNKRFW